MGGADELGGDDGPGPSWPRSQAGYRGDSSVRVREPAGHGKWAPRRQSRISELRPGLGDGVSPGGSGPEREAAGQAWPAGAQRGWFNLEEEWGP